MRPEEIYIRNAEVIRWVDGDTVELKVDVGYRLNLETKFRLDGIDTPEIFGKNAVPEGQAAKARVEELAPPGTKTVIKSYKRGKYRWLCTIWPTNKEECRSINQILVDEGHAEVSRY